MFQPVKGNGYFFGEPVDYPETYIVAGIGIFPAGITESYYQPAGVSGISGMRAGVREGRVHKKTVSDSLILLSLSIINSGCLAQGSYKNKLAFLAPRFRSDLDDLIEQNLRTSNANSMILRLKIVALSWFPAR
jgi:hypothetical protein